MLAALYELLRGFQAADDQRHGELLRDVLKDDPNQVYAGLLRVLLRLVFILYAEDRRSSRTTRSTRSTTRSSACSSGCARTPGAIPTRWTSASAPGRSS